MFKKISYLFFSFMVSSSANAIVNIEKIHKEQTKDFVGELELDFSGSSGNSETASTSLGSRFQWNKTSTQFLVIKYQYTESAGVKSADKSFMHYRYIHNPKDFSWELYAQVENDAFKLLDLRTLVGAGIVSQVNFSDAHRLKYGIGMFASEEHYNDVANSVEKINRGNFYFTYQYQHDDVLSFQSTTYYQPDIENADDYRALEQFTLELKVNERFVYFMTIDISYDNEPVAGSEKNDSQYKSGIKFSF